MLRYYYFSTFFPSLITMRTPADGAAMRPLRSKDEREDAFAVRMPSIESGTSPKTAVSSFEWSLPSGVERSTRVR